MDRTDKIIYALLIGFCLLLIVGTVVLALNAPVVESNSGYRCVPGWTYTINPKGGINSTYNPCQHLVPVE